MTTFESFKKFGLEMDSAMGGILIIAGSAVTVLGLAAVIVDQVTGNIGLKGAMLLLFLFLLTLFTILAEGLRKTCWIISARFKGNWSGRVCCRKIMISKSIESWCPCSRGMYR